VLVRSGAGIGVVEVDNTVAARNDYPLAMCKLETVSRSSSSGYRSLGFSPDEMRMTGLPVCGKGAYKPDSIQVVLYQLSSAHAMRRKLGIQLEAH